MGRQNKTDRITIRISPENKKALMAVANDKGLTLSRLINGCIQNTITVEEDLMWSINDNLVALSIDVSKLIDHIVYDKQIKKTERAGIH